MPYRVGHRSVRYPRGVPDAAPEDPLARYVEAGLALLAVTQAKAESLLKDVSSSGETALAQTHRAADWLTDRGRRATDELLEVVRREIRDQVAALGLATKDDISRLEARLTGTAGAVIPTDPPPAGDGN